MLPTRSTGGAIYRCSVDFDVDAGKLEGVAELEFRSQRSAKGYNNYGRFRGAFVAGSAGRFTDRGSVGTRSINCCSRCKQQQPRQRPREMMACGLAWARRRRGVCFPLVVW